MTKDLVAITSMPGPTPLSSKGFIQAIRKTLEEML